MTVVNLVERKGDNRLWTVEQMLADALTIAREVEYKHGLVLLAGEDGLLNPHFWAANVRVSEMIAMMEAHKFTLLRELAEEETQ